MELTGLIFGLFGNLILNVTVTPEFVRRYPASTIWLNIASSILNTLNALLALLIYRGGREAVLLAPGAGGAGNLGRGSLIAAMLAAILSTVAAIHAGLSDAGGMRILAAVVAVLGIVAVVRAVINSLSAGIRPIVG